MEQYNLNPFLYGNPVPPNRFIGRRDSIRVVFSRIYNCESTAIIGEPHIGKSSALRYIASDQVRSEWLGDVVSRCALIEVDCHLLPEGYQPIDFWAYVLDQLENTFTDPAIQTQIEVVRRSKFGSFTLERLFRLLGQNNLRVILIIDEFEALLHHPNFNTAEFFGALRSLSARTNGLLLVTASRLPIAEMNRRSEEINPLGSPFFNIFTEVRLLPLRPREVDMLLDQALEKIDVMLSDTDRTYIKRVSGRHPYLVQMAAAALFEAVAQGEAGQTAYTEASKMLRGWADSHFHDVWRSLGEKMRSALAVLALVEDQVQTGRSDAHIGGLEILEQHDQELRWLADGGLIEAVDDGAPAAPWREGQWRISAASFSQWIVDNRKWEELEPSGGKIYLTAEDRDREMKELTELLTTHRQRLHALQLQEAKKGMGVDPAITTEIKEIEDKIADIDRQLQKLQS
jgi:AAA-like domain